MVIYDVAFTYKINCKAKDRVNVTDSDYQVCLDTLAKHGKVSTHVFETDSKNRLHLHGVVELPHDIKYTHLKVKGFSSKMIRIYNRKGWIDYLSKQKDVKFAETIARELTQLVMLLEREKTHGQADQATTPAEESEPDTPKEERIVIPTTRLF